MSPLLNPSETSYPTNGRAPKGTVTSEFLRNNNSTEGKGAASSFQKCVMSASCWYLVLLHTLEPHCCSATTLKDTSSASEKYYVWKSSDLVNFHRFWIPALVALETRGCWRHLMSVQLCLRGSFGASATAALAKTPARAWISLSNCRAGQIAPSWNSYCFTPSPNLLSWVF